MSSSQLPLPVKTLSNGDVAAKIVDGTTPSQALSVDSTGRITVKLDDGSGNVITSQSNGAQRALDVGIDVAGVQVDPRQVRALTATDVVTANIKDSAGASITLGQKVSATSLPVVIASDQSTISVKDLSDGPVVPGTVAANSSLAGGQYNTALPTLTAAQQSAIQLDASGRLIIRPLTAALDTVVANQGAANPTPWNSNMAQIAGAIPSATNALPAQITTSGAFVSNTNPLPVTFASQLAGTPVNKYNTTAAVAAGATTNHNYTVTATKTFYGKKFFASSAGMIRIDVIASPDGITFTNVVYTAFSSVASPNISIDMDQLVVLDAGVGAVVRIVITNLEAISAQDAFSTISGTEL